MLRFGSVHLDIEARELLLDGDVQHLEPQAFDLLVYLVDHRDRVVPNAELFDQVWGDQFVSESALTTRIRQIRRATGDDGRTQAVIKNFRGRGYRFVASPDEPASANDASAAADRGRRQVPPRPPTPSIGLDAEIHRLAELTTARRLVTVVGPGGVGKTRLALEVGRAVAEHHALGTRIVELSRISEAKAIGPTIRRALDLGIDPDPDPDEGLGAVDACLVLDNCEHLIDAVAAQVPALLAGGDALHILATSREPLGIPGEQRWALAPLSTVGANAPALTMFVERAREMAVVVDPTDPHARTIVSHLDGIPLALEMAAASLATMGIADLAREVQRSVAALRAGPRGVAERHATLQAVLTWSEALLTDELRSTLADFSAFAGPVEAVDLPGVLDTEDPQGAVRALAERSLVTVATTTDGNARYGSLETVRQFSRERLEAEGRLDTVRRRHTEWFTAVAEDAATMYDTVDQADAVARIDAVFDELRSAHLWARAHDPSLATRLSFALLEPAYQQLRLEVFDWSLALADVLDPDDQHAAQLYGEIAVGLTLMGRLEDGRQWAQRAIDSSTDPLVVRAAYGALTDIHLYTGDLEQAVEVARRLDQLAEDGGTRLERAVAKASLALPISYLGHQAEALDLIPAEPPAGAPPTAWAWLAYARGEVLLDTDPQAALHQLDNAIAIAESVDSHCLAGVAHVAASSLRARIDQAEEAIGPLAQTIERLADRGNKTHLLIALRNVPTLLVRLEEWHSAAQVLAGLSTPTIKPTYGQEADRLAAAEQAVHAALGDDAVTQAPPTSPAQSLDQTARLTVAILNNLRPVSTD